MFLFVFFLWAFVKNMGLKRRCLFAFIVRIAEVGISIFSQFSIFFLQFSIFNLPFSQK